MHARGIEKGVNYPVGSKKNDLSEETEELTEILTAARDRNSSQVRQLLDIHFLSRINFASGIKLV